MAGGRGSRGPPSPARAEPQAGQSTRDRSRVPTGLPGQQVLPVPKWFASVTVLRDDGPVVRKRRLIGHTGTTCSLCGHRGLALTESRFLRRGLDRLRPGFDPDARVYELCGDCGAKHAVEPDA